MSRVTRPGPVPHWATLLGLAAGACGGQPPRPPDLVLIVLDTLRVDMTSVGGGTDAQTPFLEQFAAAGTRFENAHSTSCWTLPAHASMFTGELPDRHGADQMSGHVDGDVPLLAERLRAAGYQTAGFTQNPWISSRSGLDRGFEYLDSATGERGHAPDGDPEIPLVAGLRRWWAESREEERPLFLFVNLLYPHAPYRPSWAAAQAHFESKGAWGAAVQRYSSRGARELFERHYGRSDPLAPSEWELVRALYSAELEQTDRITGSLLDLIDAGCDPQTTLVLIVSDHGENLGDLDHASHMFSLNEALTHVLCLGRGPGFQAGRRDARLAQLQDVFPTFLNAAGLEASTSSGRDLRGAPEAGRALLTRVAYPGIWLGSFPEDVRESGVLARYERRLWAAQDERFKLVVASDGSEEVFDLQSADAEALTVDSGTVEPDRLARLRALVADSRELSEERGERGGLQEWSEEQLQALRALGYAR